MEMPGILRQEGVKLGGPPVLLARGEGRGGRGRGRANATNTDVDMNAEQEASELEGRGATGGENHRTRYPAAELELLTRRRC